MGRHGGGSRSGGRSSGGGGGRSSSGSRSYGSSHRHYNNSSSTHISSQPFAGSYNRSYYDRRGVYHTCYTNDPGYGTRSGWNGATIMILLCFLPFLLLMIFAATDEIIDLGGKVNGDASRIFIDDRSDILTKSEEKEIEELFKEVYEKSGMPITLVTDDMSWKDYYNNIEVYSEELYYSIGIDESSMLILFTSENLSEFYSWEYDMYCGDNTVRCFKDVTFDRLLDNFHKSLAGHNLSESLVYSWNSVMKELGKTKINWAAFPMVFFILLFLGMFALPFYLITKNERAAYKYFKKHPEKLSMEQYSEDDSVSYVHQSYKSSDSERSEYDYERPEF